MATTIVAITLIPMAGSVLASSRVGEVSRERSQATHAARRAVATLRNTPFSTVLAQYAGGGFTADGLTPQEGDQDGQVGEFVFPPLSKKGELLESTVDPSLGMPRDLNGDGKIDAQDHSTDYVVLPVMVRVLWTSHGVDRSLELTTILVDRP